MRVCVRRFLPPPLAWFWTWLSRLCGGVTAGTDVPRPCLRRPLLGGWQRSGLREHVVPEAHARRAGTPWGVLPDATSLRRQVEEDVTVSLGGGIVCVVLSYMRAGKVLGA